VADRARRSGTSGSPGGRFPARESSVSFFRLGVFPPQGLINHGFASQWQIPPAGKRETGPQPRLRPYRTPGKGHRARGELTRPRRASTSSPRARCEARARAFRVFPVAIFRKSAHLPVLKTVSYTISRRKVISERRKVCSDNYWYSGFQPGLQNLIIKLLLRVRVFYTGRTGILYSYGYFIPGILYRVRVKFLHELRADKIILNVYSVTQKRKYACTGTYAIPARDKIPVFGTRPLRTFHV